MWSRAELKQNAKQILKKNYGWAILVSLILSIVAGGGSYSSSSSFNSGSSSSSGYESDEYDFSSDDFSYSDGESDDFSYFEDDSSYEENIFSQIEEELSNGDVDSILAIVGGIAIVVLVIVLVVAILLSIFLFAPLHVGCNRWFIKNRTENPQLGEVGYAFSNGYFNTVKVMFLKGLYEGLWTLLFIIPGVVKAYEYRMIPYLLAENPQMSAKEAFARSKDMMHGNKWNAFVLDLSFYGWALLSVITCGLVGVLYFNPYRDITNTELYVTLCSYAGGNMDYGNGYNSDVKPESFNDYTSNPGGSSIRNEMFGNSENSTDYSDQKGIDQDMFK